MNIDKVIKEALQMGYFALGDFEKSKEAAKGIDTCDENIPITTMAEMELDCSIMYEGEVQGTKSSLFGSFSGVYIARITQMKNRYNESFYVLSVWFKINGQSTENSINFGHCWSYNPHNLANDFIVNMKKTKITNEVRWKKIIFNSKGEHIFEQEFYGFDLMAN